MSFSAPTRPAEEIWGWRLPTTMVDVLFLLLAFFVMLTSFGEQEKQIEVSLPGQQTPSAQVRTTQTYVTITADGVIHIGDRTYTLQELHATLAGIVKLSPNESVVIRADRDSRTGMTVRVIDVARAAGIRAVSLATTKAASDL